MVFRKRRRDTEDAFALYYASDVHGWDQCWRKFLGAGRFYQVNALLMGGDLTGKAVVPDPARRRWLVLHRVPRRDPQRQRRGGPVRAHGGDPPQRHVPVGRDRRRDRTPARADPAARAELLERVMLDELRRWVVLADERMPPLGIEVFAMAGNDDPWSCDSVLESAEHLVSCDLRVVHGRRPRDDLVLVRQSDALVRARAS